MAKQQIFDEEFKQNVADGAKKIKEKLSDALLTEDGSLDTERIGNTVGDALKKVEEGVKDSYQKFSENYVKEDGKLDTEKVEAAVAGTYQRAGRFLATGMTKLAGILTDKFGVQSEEGKIVDSELVAEEPATSAEKVPAEEAPVGEVPVEEAPMEATPAEEA